MALDKDIDKTIEELKTISQKIKDDAKKKKKIKTLSKDDVKVLNKDDVKLWVCCNCNYIDLGLNTYCPACGVPNLAEQVVFVRKQVVKSNK